MRDRPALRALLAAFVLLLLVAGSACGGQKRRARQGVFIDARLLLAEAEGYLEARKLHKAKLTLERIEYTVENRAEVEPMVRLMIADISFFEASTLSLIDARAQYLDFVTLYADHPRAPYAQLQSGVCSLKMANDPSRDQTEILQAIQDLRDVAERYPDSAYARAARDKIAEAHTSLAEHEVIVGRFYLKRGIYEAAAGRFRRALENYPRYREKDKLYYFMGKTRLLSGSDVEGRLFMDKLLTDYPDSEWTAEARKFLDGFEQKAAALEKKRAKRKKGAADSGKLEGTGPGEPAAGSED
jgi:outer membrane protein assembly factor BamD